MHPVIGAHLRHHPPVNSPLPAAAVLSGVIGTLTRRDARGELENMLRQTYGATEVWLCASGTHALRRGLELAASERRSRRVALPAYGCYDLAAAAIGADLDVLLYDLDPATLAPDLDSLEAALRAGAQLVVVASLFGIPVPWSDIEAVAASHGALLLEDAAQGLGGEWEERPIGSFGDMTILSFGRGKGWTAGRGGALLTRRSYPAIRLDSAGARDDLESVGLAAAISALGRPATYWMPASLPFLGLGDTRYRAPSDPAELPAASASMLLATRRASEEEAGRRREAGARWSSSLGDVAVATTIRPGDGGIPGFLRFPVRLPRGMGGFTDARTARRLGVAPGYPAPLSALPQLGPKLLDRGTRFPGADALVRELVTLPTHSWLTANECDAVLKAVRSYQDGGVNAPTRGHRRGRPASTSSTPVAR